MPDLLRLLPDLFGPNTEFGEYRPEQEEFARRLAGHLPYRHPNWAYAPLMLQEAGAGLGKTYVILAAASLLALQGGGRSVIATNTINLREQIGEDMRKVQEVLRAVFKKRGLRQPRTIHIGSLVSPTQYISRERTKVYDDSVARMLLSQKELDDWKEFREFVKTQTGLIDIHDWYRESGGKPLPLQLSNLSISLDEQRDSDEFMQVMEQRRQCKDADIVGSTHTALNMLMWSMRYFDGLEKSALDKDEEPKVSDSDMGEFEVLFVDEAHTLPKVTRSAIEQTLRFGVVRDLLTDAPKSIDADDAVACLDSLTDHVKTMIGTQRLLPVDGPDRYHPLLDLVLPLNEALYKLYDDHADGPEDIFIARLESVLVSLEPMIRQRERHGTSDAPTRDIADTDAYPVMIKRGNDYGIHFAAGRLGRKIASLWRRDDKNALNKRTFKTVVMVSGTLANANPPDRDPHPDIYRHFRFEIGATSAARPRQEVMWYGVSIPSVNVGAATSVIFADRSDDLVPTKRDANRDYVINPTHTNYLLKMIATAFDQRRSPNRVLALFMSEAALSAACEALPALDAARRAKRLPAIGDHLIAQHAGMRFAGKPLDLFRADPRAVLFSLNWQGINAVDENKRSLVNHLIVTKLPFPPANERLMYESRDEAAVVGLKASFEEAHWTFRQGIGRAMRDTTAQFTLWICDPRMPLPNELVRFHYPKYMRQRESSSFRSWYNDFDQLISLRLFGQYGGTGLLAKPVQLGYFSASGELSMHKVHLASRREDRIKIIADAVL